MPKAGYYAVRIGKRPGIYTTWEDCREQVDGYPCATYKKLKTLDEAEAWMQRALPYPVKQKILPANHFPDEAGASIGSEPSGRVPTSSSSTVKPAAASQSYLDSGSESQITPGLSSVRSHAVAGQSRMSATAEDVVYTDGACAGNGQHGSVAGIGVWWGVDDSRNLSERCPGRQTNNRAELIAIIRALETTPITSTPLIIKSDSQYAIKCFTHWLPVWRRHNFTTSKREPVKNVELIKYMDALFSLREHSGQQVRLQYVRGHVGEVGNEGADALAVRGAKLHEVEEPDWSTLRLRLVEEPEPKQGAIADTESADTNISMYADMLLDENDLLAELEEN